MNPARVDRSTLKTLTDLPNIGKASAEDLRLLGIASPADLCGCDPLELFQRLGRITASRQDPCVLDVLISVVRFMRGDPPQPWWAYTEERKKLLAATVNAE